MVLVTDGTSCGYVNGAGGMDVNVTEPRLDGAAMGANIPVPRSDGADGGKNLTEPRSDGAGGIGVNLGADGGVNLMEPRSGNNAVLDCAAPVGAS